MSVTLKDAAYALASRVRTAANTDDPTIALRGPLTGLDLTPDDLRRAASWYVDGDTATSMMSGVPLANRMEAFATGVLVGSLYAQMRAAEDAIRERP